MHSISFSHRGALRLAAMLCIVGGWSISASGRQHQDSGQDPDQLRRGAERHSEDGSDQRERRFRNGPRRRGAWNGRQRSFGEGDRSPLEPDEAERLAEFAEEHFPHMHKLLERIRGENPDKFRKQIQRFAPRLRFLIRMQEENPPLASLLIERTNNEHRLWQYRRAYGDGGTKARSRIKKDARVWIEKNLRLEEKIMSLRIDNLTQSRDPMIEERFTSLTKEAAEIATEPAEMRELVDVFRAAPDDQRKEIETEIRTAIAAEIDDELGAIRQRLDQREQNRAEEVDRRTRRLFSRPSRSRSRSKRP